MARRILFQLLPYSRLLKLLLTGIVLFGCCRILFLLYNLADLPDNEASSFSNFFHAFANGLRFDLAVLSYITLPYLLFLFTSHLLQRQLPRLSLFFRWYFSFLLITALLICSADIPYYRQFGTHLNRQAGLWTDSAGVVFGLIFSNISYVLFFLLSLAGGGVLYMIVRHIFRKEQTNIPFKSFAAIPVFLLLAGLAITGLRGRILAKTPIHAGAAFFSEYYFFNQLGLNPCFVFIKSLTESRKEWDFLSKGQKLPSNFGKEYRFDAPSKKHNVVIVLMESMSMSKMGHYGCRDLTSRLDSLIADGVFFDRFYSSGIHTFNGVFSTGTGFPAIMDIQPMSTYNRRSFKGLAWWLKQHGYSNYFFTSHDPQFDNLEGFMRFNHFDEVYSEEDHPSSESISPMGVPDHYLLEYAVNKMNGHAAVNSAPFFAYILTSSDHTPWAVPTDIPFRPDAEDKADKATQYADWALGNFMNEAKKQSWFSNTLFVFLGDHGVNWGHTYAMPLSYHHVPCLFYMPSELSADTISSLGGQIDIFPSIMSFLKIPFRNTSMGIDLFRETRPFMYFSADTRLGCLDKEYYYIRLPEENKEFLYRYRDLGTHNYAGELRPRKDSMRAYAEGMIRSANELIKTIQQVRED